MSRDHQPRPVRRHRRVQSANGILILVLSLCGGAMALLAGCGGLAWYWLAPEEAPARVPLMKARAGFQTRLIPNSFRPDGPARVPPSRIFQLVRYPSPAGKLAAYLTPDPRDGRKRPALVWAHGGFGGLDESLWEEFGETAAFRAAGLVVMCPSWRGECDNPGQYEMFYGEVDDAVAAVEYVSRLPYVDPERIYFAGHSTGGTLTLLTVEATDKVRAAFSFGGAPDLYSVLWPDGRGYGNTPFDWRIKKERRLRSAIDYVGFIRTPTFYFEGADDAGYLKDARKMEERAKRAGAPVTTFVVEEEEDHFSVVEPLTRLIARKIQDDTGPTCKITITGAEVRRVFGIRRPRFLP